MGVERWPIWTKLKPTTEFIERVQVSKAMWTDPGLEAHDGFKDRTVHLDKGASKIVAGAMGRRGYVKNRQWYLTNLFTVFSEHREGMGLPLNLKLLLSWPSNGPEFLGEKRSFPGRSRTMSIEGLSLGGLSR